MDHNVSPVPRYRFGDGQAAARPALGGGRQVQALGVSRLWDRRQVLPIPLAAVR
jgi:hypothetical protein